MADYDIGAAFEEIEDELISSMIRNLERHKVEEVAEGIEWIQWQAFQLQGLEDYNRKVAQKFGARFSEINDKVEESLRTAYGNAAAEQEREILKNIRTASQNTIPFTGNAGNERLDKLINTTADDMRRAESAVLRMANDKYRRIIHNTQSYADAGAATYEKVVDTATKDFLSAGINCIEYKDGRRVNIRSYAEMLERTAKKRACLQGEGDVRKKWGIYTVIIKKRNNPCPLCAPFVGKVIVDDVWSGGTAEEAREKGYLLMSECIKDGLYHPNCQDSHTTYFGDILDEEDEEEQEQAEEASEDDVGQTEDTEEAEYPTEPEKQPFTKEEQRLNQEIYNAEQKLNYYRHQAERMERMSKYSLDLDNKRVYGHRAKGWNDKALNLKEYVYKLKNAVANSENNGIIKLTDKLAALRNKIMPATNRTFEEALGISKENSERLNSIHKSLNDFMKENQKEKAVIFDLKSGVLTSKSGEISSVNVEGDFKRILQKSSPNSLILTHVHPGVTPFSPEDILVMLDYKSVKALSLECSDGSRYIITRGKNRNKLRQLLEIKEIKVYDICDDVASTKYPDAYNESMWQDVGFPFVTESAKQICDYYGLIFERVM